jgi:hypothetical protein
LDSTQRKAGSESLVRILRDGLPRIKEVSVRISLNSGGAVSPGFLSTSAGGLLSLQFPMTFQDAISFNSWVANQQVNFYVDAGVSPTVSVQTDAAHTAVSLAANATLTGYYVSLL